MKFITTSLICQVSTVALKSHTDDSYSSYKAITPETDTITVFRTRRRLMCFVSKSLERFNSVRHHGRLANANASFIYRVYNNFIVSGTNGTIFRARIPQPSNLQAIVQFVFWCFSNTFTYYGFCNRLVLLPLLFRHGKEVRTNAKISCCISDFCHGKYSSLLYMQMAGQKRIRQPA